MLKMVIEDLACLYATTTKVDKRVKRLDTWMKWLLAYLYQSYVLATGWSYSVNSVTGCLQVTYSDPQQEHRTTVDVLKDVSTVITTVKPDIGTS